MEIFYKKYRQAGFSLVELLALIGIVAVLMAILIPNYVDAKKRYEDSVKKQEIYKIKNSLRLFYEDTKTYPNSSSMVDLGVTLLPYGFDINIGHTFEYFQFDNGEKYLLRMETTSIPEGENLTSQALCGVGLTLPNYYYVCGR